MLKLLTVGHIGVVVLLIIYCALELVAFAVKLAAPSSESVRYWQPGPEMGVIAVAFFVLLGILACSIEKLNPRGWRVPAILHGMWLLSFTWFGWFSIRAPFRLRELVRVDLDDPTAVRAAQLLHTAQAAAIYAAIVALTSLVPLLAMKQRGKQRGKTV